MYPSPPSRVVFSLKAQSYELRAPHPQDVEALLESIHESLPELKRFMLWAHEENTAEFQHRRAIAAQAAYLEGKDFVFHLWHKDKILGCAGLHPRSLNPKALEVGYWIRSSATGGGLATAVVKSLAIFTFHILGYERLQCSVNSLNLASLQVAKKCGFEKEGELKYWEGQGTDEHRAQGFESGPVSIMHSITKEQLSGLDWYREQLEKTRFA